MASSENEGRRKIRVVEDITMRQKHRQSRMELSKSDMLQLLSHLETELQARDRVIATLKAEKAKQFLYQAKYGRFSLSDPLYAMQRDSDFERGPAMKSKHDDPMTQLDKLIEKQHEAEKQMKEQLHVIDRRYQKVCVELEEEKWKHNHDLEQGDSVVFMLEKDRERLQHEVQVERSQNKNLEAEVQLASDELKKFAKHREVVMKLLKKRSQIVKDINDTQNNITSLEETLRKVDAEAKRLEECAASESSKHLHIESVAEHQLGIAAREHEQLLSRLSLIESQNRELNVELDKLRSSVGPKYRHNPTLYDAHGSHGAPAVHNLTSLGDSVPVMNDCGIVLQKRHTVPPDVRMHSSAIGGGDVRLLPAKVTYVSPGMVLTTKGPGQTSEMSGSLKLIGTHVVQTRHPDVQAIPANQSVNPVMTPAAVSVTTDSGSCVSVSVSCPTSHIRRQVPTATALPGRGVPPPVPPNKPQVLITQTLLPVPPTGGSFIRAPPVAQPQRPQAPARYGVAFPQDRTAVPATQTLSSAVASGSRQTPVASSQTGSSSHLAMVVGETSTVHKHPSQVCVNIK